MFDAKEKRACVYSIKNDHKYNTFLITALYVFVWFLLYVYIFFLINIIIWKTCPNILQYINNSLIYNSTFLESFNMLLVRCFLYMNPMKGDVKNYFMNELFLFIWKSRQKSWWRFNDLTPEKGLKL